MCRSALRAGLVASLVTLAAASPAAAQGGRRFAIHATRRDTVVIDSTNSATLVFGVRNLGSVAATAQPVLTLPDSWSQLFGAATIPLTANGSETWLTGISAPASAPAGTYVVRATLREPTGDVSDSIVVRIERRRAIEVLTSDSPGFVASGDQYQATFVVRNRGNAPAHIALSLSSGAGSKHTLPETALDLAAGGKTTIVASVEARDVTRSTEDVIELVATDPSDALSSSSTARILIVPRNSSHPGEEPGLPVELSLRAAGPHAGVSPVILRGAGPITPGNSTDVDFSLRAPVGQQSIFGERDEYRADFYNPAFRVGLGDEWRSFSPLTTSGFPGFGAGMSTQNQSVNVGGYVEQNRWAPNGALESGGFIGTDTSALMSASTDVVGRNTGARVAGFTARTHLYSSILEFETAASDSAHTTGNAQRIQWIGNFKPLAFDVGGIRAGTSFSGPMRGFDDAHASITALPSGPVSFQLNSTVQHNDAQPNLLFAYAQTVTLNELDANFGDAMSLGYELLSNHHDGNDDDLAVNQQGPKVRGHYRLGAVDLRGTAAVEQLTFGNGSSQPYEMYRLEAYTDLWANQSVSLFGEESTGSAFDGLSGGGAVAGATTQLRLPLGLALNFYGSANVPRYAADARNLQGDVSLSRELRNGSTIAFREHYTKYASGISIPGMNAMYLELRTPLHVRTSPSSSTGRVTGRVTDAESGRGVSNLLVHIGDESVITDSQGRVSVAGLKPGRYGVSLEGRDRASTGVLVGDVTVDVPDNGSRPATFAVALAQSGRVRASVRQMTQPTGMVGANGDSLIDAGALEDATVVLEGARDTIYQTTDASGRLDFGRIAPGKWLVRVMPAELPDFHALNVDHYEIDVHPGETRDVEFRVVPTHRAVHMMGTESAPPVIHVAPDPQIAPTTTTSMPTARAVAPRARIASIAVDTPRVASPTIELAAAAPPKLVAEAPTASSVSSCRAWDSSRGALNSVMGMACHFFAALRKIILTAVAYV